MMHSNFNADNRLFGKILCEEMASHDIKGDALAFCAQMHKQRVYDVWKGKGDYRLSVYVRLVSALRGFYADAADYERAKARLIAAAFDDDYFREE